MASISGYDSNSISTLFSSLPANRKNSGLSMNSFNFSDYSAIRNGSYVKLMKSYYTKVDGAKENTKSTTSTSNDSTKTIAGIENATKSLTDTAKKLYTAGGDSVFKKKNVTDEAGKTSEAYDTDAIYKAVKNFVSDYNSVVEAAGKSNSDSITKAAASMVSNTNVNSKSLENIGISINTKDYSLSIDEDKFKKASMDSVKNVFYGPGSYGYATAVKSSMINSAAATEAAKSNTYSNRGSYANNFSTGDIYNSFI